MIVNLFMVLFYFMIGWMGSFLLLVTVCNLIENLTDKFDVYDWVTKLYEWIGVDIRHTSDLSQVKISLPLATIMAVYAVLGPYALIGSFVICLVALVTIVIVNHSC